MSRKVQRVEKHIIKKSNAYYKMLDNFCFLAKNLYNHANYILRHEFIENGRAVSYFDIARIMRKDEDYPDYKLMPSSQAAQQTLRLLTQNWKSFFKSIKDWKQHPEKYTGRPKLPRYKKKNGRSVLIMTNQVAKLKEGILHFPKTFNKFTMQLKCTERRNFYELNQVRFIPKTGYIVAEVVYTILIRDSLPDNEHYCGIDIGIDNLAAVTTNLGYHTFIINGRSLKSINKYYNKQIAHYAGIAKRMNGSDYTKRMERITLKRNQKITDYLHKASRAVVEYCRKRRINTIVIGHNKGWKNKVSLGMKTNQTFIGIPFQRFIEMIQYKAEELGINVKLVEESYTSGTSFLDSEAPDKAHYDKSRRISRGLFISNDGIKINADINASYQILKKAFPKVCDNGVKINKASPLRVRIV